MSRCTNTGSKEGLDNVAAAPTKQDKKRNKRAKKDGSCIEGNYNLKKKKSEKHLGGTTLCLQSEPSTEIDIVSLSRSSKTRDHSISEGTKDQHAYVDETVKTEAESREPFCFCFFFAFLLLKERKKVEYQYCCLAVASAHVRFSVCVFFFLHSFSAVIIDTVLCSQAAHADLSVL